MNYIEKSKLQGESLVKIYKPSKYYYVWPLILLIMAIFMLFDVDPDTSDAGGFVFAACLFALYYIRTIEYYVTNKRVVYKYGFGTKTK
tara:strand:+ start:197 stop:460 length:264 start_codon:yes stop_codon:yes gene_type:complete